ncbi:DUF3558 domain-containing protein [Nocardia sp. NBC_01503]|uniref:DUF3558 family protein n=1 Tax=Nocardia sp. NBC_01503 TaxID=2975997 RepID=UPI002E7C4180|nr:DUF3558 family protein [Nocardia sp. NBC_01503]WTL32749.1 DUF3558 domain-containing protein [Nocardia sp. NBC_01503]
MSARQLVNAALVLVAALAVGLFGTGCGRSSDTSTGEAPKWDPCSAFPESAMQDLGLDYKALPGGQTPGMRCTWANTQTGYSVDVQYRTKNQFTDWRTGAEDITDFTAAPYSGHTYHIQGNSHPFMCSAQLKTKNSDVVFQVTNQNYRPDDPCAFATRIATALAKYLPATP